MNYLALAGLITFISVVLCTILVLIKNIKKIVVWELGMIGLALWSFGIFKCFTTTDYNVALFWGKFLNTVAILIIPFLFHFSCYFAGKNKTKKNELITYYIIGVIYFILAIIFNKEFVNDVRPILSFKFYPTPGILYYFFPVYYLYLLVYGEILLLQSIKTATTYKKNQIIYITIGLAFSFLGGSSTFFPVVNIPIEPLGAFLPPIYVFIVAYTILQDKIMDINLAWRHIVEYFVYLFLSTSVLIGFYFLLLKFNITNLNLILCCIIPAVIIIPFFREKIKKIMRNLLLQKYKKIWNKLAKIAEDKTLRYEIKDIVQIIVKDVPEVLAVKTPVYYKLKDNGEKFKSFSLNGEDPCFLSKNNLLTERLESTRDLIYKEYLTDSEEDITFKNFLSENNIEICSPVFFNRMLVGIIAYGEKEDGTIFHKEEIESIAAIVKNMQEQIVNVLYLKYMSTNYAEQVLNTYKNTDQMELLNAIKHLGSLRNIPELSKQLIGLTNRYLTSESSRLYLYSDEKQGYIISSTNLENKNLSELIKENHCLMKYIKQRKEIVSCDELYKWAEASKSQDLIEAAELSKKLNATLIVPLIDVTLLGFIIIGERKEKDEVYSSNDLMMLSFIADRAEITISNILVRELSERDELTGTHNRAYLNNRTRVEVANSLKNGKAIASIIGDADDFKWFNDKHGYDVGNEVLKAIATALQSNIRSMDELCRWGGEEFILLAIGANSQEALIIATKMLNAVRNDSKIKELEKKYKRKISISFGISCFDPKGYRDEFTNEDIRKISEALFKRSVKALKQSKRNGKDQVFESIPFTIGEEEKNKDMFPLRELIITENKEYSNIYLDGVEIDIKTEIEEALNICKKYDVCIIDITLKNINIENVINSFKQQSRDLVLGIISPNTADQTIVESKGVEFFLSPIKTQDLGKWTEYLKSKE
jgi:diguanylate cyclase (GGDEF)-like protein